VAVSGELVCVVVAKQLSFSSLFFFSFLLPTIPSRFAHLLPSRFRCFFLLLTSPLLFLSLSLSLPPSPPPPFHPPTPPPILHSPALPSSFAPPDHLSPPSPPSPSSSSPSSSPSSSSSSSSLPPPPPLSSSTLPTVAHEHLTYLISIYPPFLRSPPLPFDSHHPASGYPLPHPQQLAPPNQN